MPDKQEPTLAVERIGHDGGVTLRASGAWLVQNIAQKKVMRALRASIKSVNALAAGGARDVRWDLSQVDRLDLIGAQFFWNLWGKARPPDLILPSGLEPFFARLAQAGNPALPPQPAHRLAALAMLGNAVLDFFEHIYSFIGLIGQLLLDLSQFLRNPARGPWKEVSANIFHIGFQALGITALVGFLIGVVLSYLSAQQLHTFGGDIYLVNILGMSIIRELGPLLAAILVAGRSGSAITAQLGVMRVTEELDAMLVMGLPHGFRLVLPKVIALALAMPLLVIWTDAMALLGGMATAQFQLGLSPGYFLQSLPGAVPLPNYWIGLGKGVVFGSLIALVSCHFGLRIKPNTESLGHGTTTSVVSAITVTILADAVFAIVFNKVGY
ncbi:ABC transporter permease [Herminiimonas sp. CN]|uniref:MlaE family ABC transporter permease n=1 Tax=Herminiimonas sp. CN TaxID=1349818 RepID=UPI000473CE8C|nr:ABC transporter permease [Herminiimonas sp. CN]